MTVDDLITEIIEREGREYTNHPYDKGGPTRYGVTQRTLSLWRGRPVTPEDVAALEEAEAREIYRKEYVTRWGFDAFGDPLQALLIDWSVTSGPDNPIKALQRVLKVPVDGVIGPRTKAAYALADKRAVYVAMVRLRTLELVEEALDGPDEQLFIKTHPKSQLRTLKGWVRRALEFIV